MELVNQCHCCLQRPAVKDLHTPYSSLDIKETYVAMIEECFVIKLTPCIDGQSGICEECVERLREACRFKTQVQQCQAELQARLAAELSIKDEGAWFLPEDGACDEPLIHEQPQSPLCGEDPLDRGGLSLCEETIIESEVDEYWAADIKPDVDEDWTANVEVDEKRIHEDYEECSDESRVPDEATAREERLSPSARAYYVSLEPVCTCDTCRAQLAEKARLIRHLPQHDARATPRETTAYCCDTCAQRFTSKTRLIRHIRTHEDPKRDTCEVGKQFRLHSVEKPYGCGTCNKRFSVKSKLTQHERIHAEVKPYKCYECNKQCTTKFQLNYHNMIHSRVKPYTCKECNKQFTLKCHLDRHELIHSGEKPYKCKECKKQFTQRAHLNMHKMIHSGVKPHKCKECNKQFTSKSDLNRHERIHSGIKPYKCKECNKQFTRISNLNIHKMIHSGVSPFTCKNCSKQFSSKQNLVKHERRCM